MIRPGVAADAEPVDGLVEQAYAAYVPRIGLRPAPMDADHPSEIERGELFVLEDDGELLGVIVLVAEHETLWIENVAVAPAAQGGGPRRLADRVCRAHSAGTRARGCPALHPRAHDREHRLLPEAGFSRSGTPRGERLPSGVHGSPGFADRLTQLLTDARIQALADLLCGYSLDVQPGQVVVISAPAVAQPLVVEVVKGVTSRGGHPVVRASLESVSAAQLGRAAPEQLAAVTELDHLEVEIPDRRLVIWASENTRYLHGISSERLSRRSQALEPLEKRVSEREMAGEVLVCGTHFPTHAAAQDAGMSLADWEDFVFAAGHVGDADPAAHWRERHAAQQIVADRLAQVGELRITAPGTDLRVTVAGRTWINASGRENFPDGEVYTSPHHELTEGTIAFSFRSIHEGKLVDGVRLRFENGRVVEADATHGRDHLVSLLDSDPGARFLGEVAFGLNDEITTATGDTLFDEKIGGTCHVALGMAFPEAGGSNPSGVHWDLVCDLRQNGRVYGDGELIYENGRFL